MGNCDHGSADSCPFRTFPVPEREASQQTTAVTNNPQADQMASTMKTMNVTLPLVSVFMCFTLPTGLGIYWVASAVVRMVQQFFINNI